MGVCLVMKYMVIANQIAKTTIAIYIGDILAVVHYISNITKHFSYNSECASCREVPVNEELNLTSDSDLFVSKKNGQF